MVSKAGNVKCQADHVVSKAGFRVVTNVVSKVSNVVNYVVNVRLATLSDVSVTCFIRALGPVLTWCDVTYKQTRDSPMSLLTNVI